MQKNIDTVLARAMLSGDINPESVVYLDRTPDGLGIRKQVND